MSDTPRSPHFNEKRSQAIEELLSNAARDGTTENRHFQSTKGKRVLFTGLAAAVAISGAAIAMQQPVTDKGSIACFARAELNGNRFPGATVTVGVPSTTERPDSRIMIDDALSVCRDVWAQNQLDPDDPDGGAHPSLHDPSFSHPVPPELTVCVLNDGRAAVIPGDENVCASLGLASKTDTATPSR